MISHLVKLKIYQVLSIDHRNIVDFPCSVELQLTSGIHAHVVQGWRVLPICLEPRRGETAKPPISSCVISAALYDTLRWVKTCQNHPEMGDLGI